MNRFASIPAGAAATVVNTGQGFLFWTQVTTTGTGSGNLVFTDGYTGSDLAIDTGTSEVDTLTIGGIPTSGTFTLVYSGQTTAAITWSAVNATLLANINTAVRALSNVGGTAITATAGTVTAGIGTILLTFSGALANQVVTPITVGTNSLAGTSPTLAVAQTTPGVNPVTNKVTSASHSFTSTDVGLPINVNSGTGFVPASLTIQSVNGGAAFLSGSAGAGGSTGGSYKVGSGQVLLQIPANAAANLVTQGPPVGIPYFTALIATNVVNGPVTTILFT